MENKPRKYFFFRSFFKLFLINIGFTLFFWGIVYIDLLEYIKSHTWDFANEPVRYYYHMYSLSRGDTPYVLIRVVFIFNIYTIFKIYFKKSNLNVWYRSIKSLLLLALMTSLFFIGYMLIGYFFFGDSLYF